MDLVLYIILHNRFLKILLNSDHFYAYYLSCNKYYINIKRGLSYLIRVDNGSVASPGLAFKTFIVLFHRLPINQPVVMRKQALLKQENHFLFVML